ncbi:MAG: hypothetical protein ACFFE6_10670 [Candidatus Thorarchaeota archaeon]
MRKTNSKGGVAPRGPSRVPPKKLITVGRPRDKSSMKELTKKKKRVMVIHLGPDEDEKKMHYYEIKNRPFCGVRGASLFTRKSDEITCRRCLKKVE